GSQAERVLGSIMERVEHYNGLLLVNFHNTYLNRDTFPDVLELYEGLIDRVFERGYWVTTASECSEWWRRRASAKVGVGPEWGKSGENGDVQLEVIDRIEPSIAKGVRN
ncbi:MAG TPA: hypothetical protein VGR56_02280, partial [Nitrososphaerales archaeon]|nr:hypothetical protein [Nitrososphaerales archaeon]